jgi:hypothetical protein
MAALQDRNGSYRVIFRYEGRQHSVPVGKVPQGEAEAFLGKVEHLLLRIKQRWVEVPAGVTVTEFILADGQVKAPEEVTEPKEPITFGEFSERNLEAHSGGAMEANSLATVAMHLNHFRKTLGEGFLLEKLALADLQRHVNRRAKKKQLGRRLPASARGGTGPWRTTTSRGSSRRRGWSTPRATRSSAS